MFLRNRSRLWLGFVLVAILAVPTLASAATIRLLTGVDAAEQPLGQDALDPFWTISVQGGGFTAARAAAPGHDIICCGMETVGTQANWISDPSIRDGSTATNWGVGPMAFARRSFDLTGVDVSTAMIIGTWRVADNRFGVYINGNLVDPATANGGNAWFADQAFSSAPGSGFFVSGTNTIELRGNSINSNWDGFWLDATVTARDLDTGVVPEPGTLSLLGVGLAAAARARKRRSA